MVFSLREMFKGKNPAGPEIKKTPPAKTDRQDGRVIPIDAYRQEPVGTLDTAEVKAKAEPLIKEALSQEETTKDLTRFVVVYVEHNAESLLNKTANDYEQGIMADAAWKAVNSPINKGMDNNKLAEVIEKAVMNQLLSQNFLKTGRLKAGEVDVRDKRLVEKLIHEAIAQYAPEKEPVIELTEEEPELPRTGTDN